MHRSASYRTSNNRSFVSLWQHTYIYICVVGLFPFDDHNAPPFELIQTFCQNVQEWLDTDKQNIAVIHCKAGKGRTGLMICAWLLFTREWRTPEEALDFYAAMRTENKKGVTIPSQIRYVKYFHESLITPFALRPLLLQRLVFHTLPKTGSAADVNFTVHVGKTLVFTYRQFVEMHKLKDEPKVRRMAETKKRKKGKKDTKRDAAHILDDKEVDEDGGEWNGRDHQSGNENIGVTEEEDLAVFECGGVPVCGDVKIDFEKQGTRIFAFWFNSFFVKGLSLMINKEGLDKGNKDKHHKLYEETFRVEAVFIELTQEAPRKFGKANSSANISHISNTSPSSANVSNISNISSDSAFLTSLVGDLHGSSSQDSDSDNPDD
jgi:phosphatidylinositol-3,4,5-trisphosphate 3-phosphatase/dual-specificity protein phosphatase PTEN